MDSSSLPRVFAIGRPARHTARMKDLATTQDLKDGLRRVEMVVISLTAILIVGGVALAYAMK